MSHLPIFRDRADNLTRVGTIDLDARCFAYDESYLRSDGAAPLSFSLPLSDSPFAESAMRPYFEGLLPEGPALRALAQRLEVRESDYLAILARCGLDCLGDVVIDPQTYREQSYEPLALGDLEKILSESTRVAATNASSRLSLAGTQEKIGLHHVEGLPYTEGWSKPLGGAASTHILKAASLPRLSIVEYLSIACAEACGVACAETRVLGHAGITCSKRFDRITNPRTNKTTRLHQEDFTQALGLLPGSKYGELPGGTVASLSRFIMNHSAQPLRDITEFAKLTCFNYLIGNCDNHLKNISLLYGSDWKTVRLAPAYDLVSTTAYARFSREMAMSIGGVRAIDDIEPEHVRLLARDLGIAERALKRICDIMVKKAVPALQNAGTALADAFPEAPYCADDLEEDMAPRLEVLRIFCST